MSISFLWVIGLSFLFVQYATSNGSVEQSANNNIVSDENPPVCTDSVDDAIIENLIDWIRENGGIVDDRQVVKKDDPDDITTQTNVIATSFIPEGTVLLSVPFNLVIRNKSETSNMCDVVNLVHEELINQEKSKFGPYLKYLEALSDPFKLPIAWSKGGKDLLTQVLGEKLLQDPDAIDAGYWLWKHQCSEDTDDISDAMNQAVFLVVGYQSPNPFADPGWYQMIPFFDFYSPKEEEFNTEFVQDEVDENIVIKASRDIEAGERIYTLYGFGEKMGKNRQFIDSGLIERLHFFDFQDTSAPALSRDLDVKFYLDRKWDESGETFYALSWDEGIYASSRSYRQVEKELKRVKEISKILANETLYFLHPAAQHERQAIQEYTLSLVNALSLLLSTEHNPQPVTPWTIREYNVAGANLGSYNLQGVEQDAEPEEGEKPFELFADFDISELIVGNENWKDMIEYRRMLDRPRLRFYVDKVARKRWLPLQGMPQAKQYVTIYGHELTGNGDEDEEAKSLHALIPDEKDYAAKPSHHSEGESVWLVSHDKEKNVTKFSSTARELKEDEDKKFDKMNVATDLTNRLHVEAAAHESLILRGVQPGVIVEERFVEVDHYDRAPVEINTFVIWGRVWIMQVNNIAGDIRFANAWLYRDGSLIHDVNDRPDELDYIDLSRIVEISEKLGRNKDMFRVDIFVGIPAGKVKANATREERLAAVEYAVNECEVYPTTSFTQFPQLAQDGARLWVAGYKMGNYRIIPNDEIP